MADCCKTVDHFRPYYRDGTRQLLESMPTNKRIYYYMYLNVLFFLITLLFVFFLQVKYVFKKIPVRAQYTLHLHGQKIRIINKKLVHVMETSQNHNGGAVSSLHQLVETLLYLN